MISTGRARLTLLCSTAILGASMPMEKAFSQEENSVKAGLDQVVVTARRRVEAIEDVPVAITVTTGDEIAQRQIDNVAQVAEAVPNVTYQTGAPTGTGGATSSVFIRGVGSQETSLGTEPGVGLYVDDVYIARSVGSVLDLVSPESVQVLRGPQGTLFGRNSVGGAILIRSKSPGEEFGGWIEGKTGSFDRTDARISLDIPLSETLRTNITGMRAYRDGYVESLDSDAMGSIDRYAGRLSVEWEATPDFNVRFAADYTNADETAMPAVLLGLVDFIPGTEFVPGGPFPSAIFGVTNNAGSCGGATTAAISGNPNCIDQQWILGPHLTAGGYQAESDIFESQGSRPFGNTSIIETWGANLHLEWALSQALTVKSITAYRELEAYWASNSDHTPLPGIETKNDQEQSQLTQELQLLGSHENLEWVAGVFYMHEDGNALNVVAFPSVIFRSGGGFETNSTAVFAQGTYEILPSLELTLGARYTWETKKYDTLNNQQIIGFIDTSDFLNIINRNFVDTRAMPIPFVTGGTPDLKSSEFTPLANIAYHVSDDLMVYASYSRGYKSGGYEQRLAPGTPAVPMFNPEFVDSYEVGVKSDLADGRVTLSAAGFHTEYSDMQISVVDGVAPTLTNAGEATIDGGEVEIQIRPTNRFSVKGYVGYLDAGYDSLSPRALASGIQLSSRLPHTSEWQYGASASYEFNVFGEWTLIPNIDWSYRSSLELDSANEPLLHQPGYSLLNSALTLITPNERWSLSAAVRNLTAEDYLVAGIAQYNIGEIEGQYGRPREWSLSLRVNF